MDNIVQYKCKTIKFSFVLKDQLKIWLIKVWQNKKRKLKLLTNSMVISWWVSHWKHPWQYIKRYIPYQWWLLAWIKAQELSHVFQVTLQTTGWPFLTWERKSKWEISSKLLNRWCLCNQYKSSTFQLMAIWLQSSYVKKTTLKVKTKNKNWHWLNNNAIKKDSIKERWSLASIKTLKLLMLNLLLKKIWFNKI